MDLTIPNQRSHVGDGTMTPTVGGSTTVGGIASTS